MSHDESSERSSGSAQLLHFRVGLAQLAIAAEHVDEIVSVEAPTAVPGVPPHVVGIVAVRGDPVPLLDLRRFLGLTEGAGEDDREARVLVVRGGPYRVGIVCDLVTGIRTVRAGRLGSPEGVHPPVLREHARAQIDHGDAAGESGVTVLLDLPRLLEAARA